MKDCLVLQHCLIKSSALDIKRKLKIFYFTPKSLIDPVSSPKDSKDKWHTNVFPTIWVVRQNSFIKKKIGKKKFVYKKSKNKRWWIRGSTQYIDLIPEDKIKEGFSSFSEAISYLHQICVENHATMFDNNKINIVHKNSFSFL